MLDRENILEAINKARKGIRQYTEIMSMLYGTDVSRDRGFQRKYNHFYKVRSRSQDFYAEYYSIMENGNYDRPHFDTVLDQIKSKFNRCEASFSSKLVATLDPWMPVWDVYVLKNTEIRRPASNSPTQIDETKKDIQENRALV